MSRSPEPGVPEQAACLRRVLVVDDEPTLRLGFRFALITEDYEVETATDGVDALGQLDESEFDLLVIDFRMPQLDGLAVVRKLREQGSRIPAVLVSAYLTSETVLQAVSFGVVDFLAKPVRPNDLRGVVGRVVRGAEGAQSELDYALACARRLAFSHASDALADLEPDRVGREGVKVWKAIFDMLADRGSEESRARLEEAVGGGSLIPLLAYA